NKSECRVPKVRISDFEFRISRETGNYPAWIRTRTKRTKISCATVTLPGNGPAASGAACWACHHARCEGRRHRDRRASRGGPAPDRRRAAFAETTSLKARVG